MKKSGFAEHMIYMRMENGCWKDAQLAARAQVMRCPQNSGVFFGLTATETVRVTVSADGTPGVFCAQNAVARLNVAAGQLLLPPVDEEPVMNALCRLVDAERAVLSGSGSSFARIMLSCDDGALYPYPVNHAFLTITLWLESKPQELELLTVCTDTRGDTSYAPGKTAAYLGQMCKLREMARQAGFDRMLLLDGVYKKYILSLSGSNVFFRIGDSVVTPDGEGVFPGIVRKCAIELMQSWEIEVVRRRISRDELILAYESGTLHEAFATDSYGIVSALTAIDGPEMSVRLECGKLTRKLFDAIVNIQKGTYPDLSGWIKQI